MIISYAERLAIVRQFTQNGRTAAYIDEQVKFDDQPAKLTAFATSRLPRRAAPPRAAARREPLQITCELASPL